MVALRGGDCRERCSYVQPHSHHRHSPDGRRGRCECPRRIRPDPLHWVAKYGFRRATITALLEVGADATTLDAKGKTPWDYV